MKRLNFHRWLWLLFAAALLWLPAGARAQISQASSPLLSAALKEQISTWHTLKPHQIYFIITASGAGTDMLALAPPQTASGPALAQALATALQPTSLHGQTVQWQETGDWSAAHARRATGHFGAGQAVNAVPVGAMDARLHKAGLHALTALCVPHVAFAGGLSDSFSTDDAGDWYDVGGSHAPTIVHVRDWVSAADVATLLTPFVALPLLGLIGLRWANRWARGKEMTRQERKKYDLFAGLPMTLGVLAWMMWQIVLLTQPSALDAVADVWFGVIPGLSSALWPGHFISVILFAVLCGMLFQQQVMRRCGPSNIVSPAAMTPAERSFRARSQFQGSLISLLVMVAGVLVVFLHPGLVPPAYGRAVIPLLLLLASIPYGLYEHKKAKAFTTQAPDEGLTDIARRVGSAPGYPAPEVVIEQSARAREFAFMENQRGGGIIVSQKLAESANADEMAFLLAHQAALSRIPNPDKAALPLLLIGLLVVVSALPRWFNHTHFHGAVASSVLILGLLVLLVVTFWLIGRVLPRREQARLLEADRRALAETKNPAAAMCALEILREYAAPVKGPGNSQGYLVPQLKARLAALAPEEKRDATLTKRKG